VNFAPMAALNMSNLASLLDQAIRHLQEGDIDEYLVSAQGAVSWLVQRIEKANALAIALGADAASLQGERTRYSSGMHANYSAHALVFHLFVSTCVPPPPLPTPPTHALV